MRIFNIDISRKGISPVVQVTEHDAMSRFFTLILRNGNADYEPPENPTYSVWYKTKDSTGWYDTITLPDESTRPAVVADGNAFTIEIAEQATTSCGELALMITGDDGYQLTVTGIITQSADIPGYDSSEVENYYNVYITEMRENAARAENAAATAIEYGATVEVDETAQQLIITHTDNTEDVQTWVTEAEAWAVGQRGGEDVPSTDETYHNNAKYYAGQAGTAASSAASSATSASSSASSASSSASSANSSKTAAANSATAASTSATNASTSASQAAASATSAANANTSAQAAKTAAEAAAAEASLYKATVITEEASGIIASFSDGADDIPMQSLVAEITPVQSGSGDPSPTNIRPISGRTGMTVTAAGTNLLPPLASETKNGVTISVADDGTVTINGTASTDTYFDANFSLHISSGTPYYLCGFNPVASSSNRLTLFLITTDGNGQVNLNSANAVFSSTTSTDVTVSRWRFRVPAALSLTNYIVKPMLQIGGSAPSNYEPYTAQTYPITWESIAGTVYGGTLDVVSGVMTVTHGYILLDGTQAIRTNGRTAISQSAFVSIDGKAVGTANMQSDRFFVTSSGDVVGKMNGRAASNGIEFYLPLDGTADTDASCKQWFADNNTQLVYELATPQTYQLTPTEVRTLLGGNNIYTGAGDVSVEYVADTKLYIDNKVAELQALILEN